MEPARSFCIGDFVVSPLWDGTLDTELSYIVNMDPGTARGLVAEAAAATGSNPLVLPVWAFLIQHRNRRILVDTGGGTSKGDRLGQLPQSLARLGLSPEDIDTVGLTHLHRDHYCGLVKPSGEPRFKRARLVLHRAEAMAWLDTPDEQMHPRSRRHSAEARNIVGLYADRLERVDDGELIPGLSIELAPGHTPGHACFVIRSAGKTAVAIGDVVHLAAVQVPRPDAIMHYDCDPETAGVTRRRVLGRCVADKALVMGAHLPVPGIARIASEGDGFRLLPA